MKSGRGGNPIVLLPNLISYSSFTSSSNFPIISVVDTPSASALKLVTMRCLKTGLATALMSSIDGVNLPSKMALVLAPSIMYCEALGPAPQETQFLI